MPISVSARESTTVPSRCANVVARAGRLVHLAEHEHALRLALDELNLPVLVEDGVILRVLLALNDVGLDELFVEVVAFAGALADAGEHREAALHDGGAADQLLKEHGLADAGASEQADLATAGERAEQVDDLDARLEHLHLHVEIGEQRLGA